MPGQLGGQHLAVVGEVAGVRRRVVDQPLGRLRRLQLPLLLQRGVHPDGAPGGDPVGALEGGLVHGGDRLRAHQRRRVEAHLSLESGGFIFTSNARRNLDHLDDGSIEGTTHVLRLEAALVIRAVARDDDARNGGRAGRTAAVGRLLRWTER